MVSQIQIQSLESQDNQEGKTLIIEKYDYGFRFYFDDPNDNKSYFIKQDPDNPKAYEIVEEEGLEAKDIWSDLYENNGVANLCGYFIMLLMDPEEMLEMFFGEEIPIKEVVIENYSEKYPHGFEGSCDMWDLVRPKDSITSKDRIL
jgi:hypothetical protein